MENRRLPAGVEPDALGWVGLGLCAGLEPRQARSLVDHFGSPGAVLGAAPEALRDAGLTPDGAARVGRARAAAGPELAAITATGARVVVWPDPAYPPRLGAVADPPLALVVRGTLVPEDEVAVAIVGARRASEYGRRIAEELARGLALAGVTVVSGLAAGIDAAAHRGALAAGGRTIAVLGTGIDIIYPSWHRALAAAVAGAGALVTELPCGAPPLQFHFPRRNRLISGLTLGTVVVEAAEQSGSLITAQCALEQGREVFAVPGPVGPAAHRGPHRLIRQGARLVTSAEDVLAELAPQCAERLAAARTAAAASTLAADERELLAALGPDGRHVDDVIRRAAVAPAAALETLLALELRGLVDQLPGKRFRRRAA